MTVRCNCRDGHREHEFASNDNRLCRHCGHAVSAHRATDQVNADVADRIVRMLHVYDIAEWSIHVGDDGGLLVKMYLTSSSPARSPS
jgi:hypothetical protein